MPDIVVAGHICLDIIPEIPPNAGALDPGRLIEVGPATLSTGGAVSNVGVALSILQKGDGVRLVGKVGDDAFGKVVAELLEARGTGLSDALIVAPGQSTSTSIVLSRPGQDRTFLHFPGANDTFESSDVEDAVFAGARHLHFGYPPLMRRFFSDGGQELGSLMARALSHGLTTSLDMSLPDPNSESGRADWEAILMVALPYVDFFFPSLDELAYMLRDVEPIEAGADCQPALRTVQALATRCLEMGAKVVVVKCGIKGLYLRSGPLGSVSLGAIKSEAIEQWSEVELWMPTYDVSVAGTTGSGDATIAGFLSALNELGPFSCLASAAIAGACCVQAADALSGIVSLSTASDRARGWQMRDFPFPEQREDWTPVGHAWRGPNDSRQHPTPSPQLLPK